MEKTKEELISDSNDNEKKMIQYIYKIYDEVMPGWEHGNCYSAVKMVIIAKKIVKEVLK